MKVLPITKERELLLRLRDGDHQAFEIIYQSYKDPLARNLISLLKDDVIVEDTLQELFFKIWEKRKTLDVNQPIAGFLYKVSANLAYDHFRKLARDEKLANDFWEIWHVQSDNNTYPKEFDEVLYRIIEQLPPQRRRVFELCKFQAKSYQEVADQLGISISAVRDHIIKANKFLKNAYKHPEVQSIIAAFIISQMLKGVC